jgi:hypothetical protein
VQVALSHDWSRAMNPQPPKPPPEPQKKKDQDKELDQELDRELDDTFPASDPLPWSHEVK